MAKTELPKYLHQKLNLKVQNIHIKPLMKPKNTCFKTAYLSENVKKNSIKCSPKLCHFFELLNLFKKS
jgi:hypothetical protein